MKKNLGSLDKILRMVFGVVILVIGYLNESWWGLIGLVLVLTSFVSFCPIYAIFNLSTLKTKEK